MFVASKLICNRNFPEMDIDKKKNCSGTRLCLWQFYIEKHFFANWRHICFKISTGRTVFIGAILSFLKKFNKLSLAVTGLRMWKIYDPPYSRDSLRSGQLFKALGCRYQNFYLNLIKESVNKV